MHKNFSKNTGGENRSEPRFSALKNFRVEIKLVGEPIYQFKAVDVSNKGAGLLIKDDSDFLSMINPGQFVEANFISPKGSNPSGLYTAEIKHITKPEIGFRTFSLTVVIQCSTRRYYLIFLTPLI